MASKEDDKPVDSRDVNDILDAEGKEWEKASCPPPQRPPSHATVNHQLTRPPPHQDAEIDRILKAFRLDAYAVLGLKPGVPESDIKIVYRKKSLLIHPDKTKNPLAPDAFDRLKKAQTELMDEKHRTLLDEAIADARMLVLRDLKLTVDSPEAKEPDAAFEKKWADKTKMVLIDNEQRRRRQMKAQMQEEGREQRKEDAEIEERKRKRQHEQDWEATRDVRIDSWRSFQQGKKGGGGEGPSKKKKKMKPIG